MPPGPVIQVRVTEEQLAWVDQRAEQLGVTRSGVMKMALTFFRRGVEQHAQEDGLRQRALVDVETLPKVPPPPPPKAYPRTPDDCPHTYRNPNGICWACGEKGRVR